MSIEKMFLSVSVLLTMLLMYNFVPPCRDPNLFFWILIACIVPIVFYCWAQRSKLSSLNKSAKKWFIAILLFLFTGVSIGYSFLYQTRVISDHINVEGYHEEIFFIIPFNYPQNTQAKFPELEKVGWTKIAEGDIGYVQGWFADSEDNNYNYPLNALLVETAFGVLLLIGFVSLLLLYILVYLKKTTNAKSLKNESGLSREVSELIAKDELIEACNMILQDPGIDVDSILHIENLRAQIGDTEKKYLGSLITLDDYSHHRSKQRMALLKIKS
ncbi:MAG TPA: hypothetical protein PLZ12_01780 [Saprospiraceae bacterium]|nr:hypothetical protein [Saprospiraceae bacterium]